MIMGQSLSAQIYDVLVEKILSNELASGEFINRRDVASQMNVSAAPVLEAMVKLENEGLLETIPRKGTRVRLVQNADISGYLLVREGLECSAARIYCGDILKSKLDFFIPLAEEIDQIIHHSKEFFKMDREFHYELIKLCNNLIVTEEYERITQLGLFYNTNRFISPVEAAVRHSHVKLIKDLSDAKPNEAYNIMRDHIISGKGHLILTR
jgi:DNA-binding GntR family transcriptional regulator